MNPSFDRDYSTAMNSDLTAPANDIKLGTTERLKQAKNMVYDIKANLDRLNSHFFAEPTAIQLNEEATCFNEEVDYLATNLDRINLALSEFMSKTMN